MVVTVTDPAGNTATDELSVFDVLAQDEHDGDEDGFAEIDGDCDDEDDSINPDAPSCPTASTTTATGASTRARTTSTTMAMDMPNSMGTVMTRRAARIRAPSSTLDEIDNDCDGVIDEGTEAYDDDGDCACEGTDDVTECTGSISTTCDVDALMTGDCDDADEDLHPLAVELCDTVDNDCDGLTDEADPDTDHDSDGFSVCGAEDCDDDDPGLPRCRRILQRRGRRLRCCGR